MINIVLGIRSRIIGIPLMKPRKASDLKRGIEFRENTEHKTTRKKREQEEEKKRLRVRGDEMRARIRTSME